MCLVLLQTEECGTVDCSVTPTRYAKVVVAATERGLWNSLEDPGSNTARLVKYFASNQREVHITDKF